MSRAEQERPDELAPGWVSLVPMGIAFDAALSDSEFRILSILIGHADSQGFCFPSQRAIADKTNKSYAAVRRAITGLVQKGYIVVCKERFDPAGRRTSNGYQLSQFEKGKSAVEPCATKGAKAGSQEVAGPGSATPPKMSRAPLKSEQGTPPKMSRAPSKSEQGTPPKMSRAPSKSEQRTPPKMSRAPLKSEQGDPSKNEQTLTNPKITTLPPKSPPTAPNADSQPHGDDAGGEGCFDFDFGLGSETPTPEPVAETGARSMAAAVHSSSSIQSPVIGLPAPNLPTGDLPEVAGGQSFEEVSETTPAADRQEASARLPEPTPIQDRDNPRNQASGEAEQAIQTAKPASEGRDAQLRASISKSCDAARYWLNPEMVWQWLADGISPETIERAVLSSTMRESAASWRAFNGWVRRQSTLERARSHDAPSDSYGRNYGGNYGSGYTVRLGPGGKPLCHASVQALVDAAWGREDIPMAGYLAKGELEDGQLHFRTNAAPLWRGRVRDNLHKLYELADEAGVALAPSPLA